MDYQSKCQQDTRNQQRLSRNARRRVSKYSVELHSEANYERKNDTDQKLVRIHRVE